MRRAVVVARLYLRTSGPLPGTALSLHKILADRSRPILDTEDCVAYLDQVEVQSAEFVQLRYEKYLEMAPTWIAHYEEMKLNEAALKSLIRMIHRAALEADPDLADPRPDPEQVARTWAIQHGMEDTEVRGVHRLNKLTCYVLLDPSNGEDGMFMLDVALQPDNSWRVMGEPDEVERYHRTGGFTGKWNR